MAPRSARSLSDSQVALLSIHPSYADAIFNGEKRVELRKTRLRKGTTHVAVYATRPVQKVVGVFTVGEVDVTTPGKLWSRHGRVAGMTRAAFDDYFEGRDIGVAIGVGTVTPFAEPVSLEAIDEVLRPPQNVVYLNQAAARRLKTLLDVGALRRRRGLVRNWMTALARAGAKASAGIARAVLHPSPNSHRIRGPLGLQLSQTAETDRSPGSRR